MAVEFEEALAEAAARTQQHIAEALADARGPVADAMRYAVTGGKGLRAFLVLESARLHGVAACDALAPAAAIEAMHSYSLVHDDLTCMDDDDLRRGQPTVHRKWDEATAVLAGDALQTLAFQLVAGTRCPAEAVTALISSLAQAAGVHGMVGGQATDIAAETATEPFSLEAITALQAGKTGALFEWAVLAGPRMAGADTTALQTYARDLGLAFQIADDILDIEGDAATVGKATGKDATAGKATFVSHLGLEGAKSRARDLVNSACDALTVYGAEGETLRQAAAFVIARNS